MKRITPPKCQTCGGAANYESDAGPSLTLCHPCVQRFLSFLYRKMPEVMVGNPLVKLLMVEEADGRLGIPIDMGDWSYRQIYFQDSQNDS